MSTLCHYGHSRKSLGRVLPRGAGLLHQEIEESQPPTTSRSSPPHSRAHSSLLKSQIDAALQLPLGDLAVGRLYMHALVKRSKLSKRGFGYPVFDFISIFVKLRSKLHWGWHERDDLRHN